MENFQESSKRGEKQTKKKINENGDFHAKLVIEKIDLVFFGVT